MLEIVTYDADSDDLVGMLDEPVAECAQRMSMAGFEPEVTGPMEQHWHLVYAEGHRLVVRNVSRVTS